MPITPGGRFSPGDADEWDLTTDLAAMQVSNETATGAEIAAAIAAAPQNFRVGSNAQRLALSGAALYPGLTFRTTDTALTWISTSSSAAGWRIAPGQVLDSMVGPASNTSGANSLVGSILSTPVLPIGQRVKIVGSASIFATVAGGVAVVDVKFRNSASNVSATTFDGSQSARGYSPGASSVAGNGAYAILATATAAAKISAAMYTTSATSGVYGPDGTHLWIESA